MDGRNHNLATIGISVLMLAPIAAYATLYHDLPATLMLPMGGFTGMLIGCDLDIDEGNISYKYTRNMGQLFGFFWSLYWWPYAKLVPHRSMWSHWILLGTIIRVVYAFWWILPLAYYWQFLPKLSDNWLGIVCFIIGLAVVDTAHILMDWASTRVKGWIRKLRERMHQWAFGNGS